MRVSGSVSVAANATSANQMSGKISEIVRSKSMCKFYATASATGITSSLTSGPEVVLEPGSAVSQANRFPVVPDDLIASDIAMPGDRLAWTFTNTTAGALTVFWMADITPIA